MFLGVCRYVYEIIYNLCDNAIRYNVENGKVRISINKETGGTGLGLSIVKHAVQYHGGKMLIDSEVGKGTTIKIAF